MSNQKEYNLIKYLITILFGAILTGPGGAFLSPLIFFLLIEPRKGLFIKANGEFGLFLEYYLLF